MADHVSLRTGSPGSPDGPGPENWAHNDRIGNHFCFGIERLT